MKLSITKSAAIIAALAMATTGTLVLNQNKADAATVATTNSGSYAHLYTDQGKLITNRALAPNTPWLVGKTATINGETMYQVATNEYLKSSDSSLSGNNANQQQNTNPGTVLTIVGPSQFLYNDTTNSLSNRALGSGSKWQVDKVITNSKGDRYYQVSTHEWVKKSYNSILNHDTGDGQYIANFMINADSSSNTNDNNNGNTEITTPDTNQNNSSSQQESSTPNLSAVQTAVFNSINAERQSKGLSPLILDSSLTKAGEIRAQEQSVKFGHTRPNGNNAQSVLAEVGNTSTYYGENLFGTYWNQLSVQTPEHYAYVVMDNYRGEIGTENHYVNLMRPKYGKVGIGAYYASDGTLYVAEEFTK